MRAAGECKESVYSQARRCAAQAEAAGSGSGLLAAVSERLGGLGKELTFTAAILKDMNAEDLKPRLILLEIFSRVNENTDMRQRRRLFVTI